MRSNILLVHPFDYQYEVPKTIVYIRSLSHIRHAHFNQHTQNTSSTFKVCLFQSVTFEFEYQAMNLSLITEKELSNAPFPIIP